MSRERIQELIVEKSDVPVPYVMKEIVAPEERVQPHRRVFNMDDCDELIPEWLNFVMSVADSVDLPLNIPYETLQPNKILRVIKKNHVTKYLEMLAEIAELNDDYQKLHEQFVKCLKLGFRENSVDGVEIAELLRFNMFKPGDEQFSFEEYVDCMKEGQNDIHCITGESIATVSSRLFRENLRKQGYEVLHVVDPVDEYAVHQPKEFDGTKPKMTTFAQQTRQQHKQRATTQTAQEEERENEGRVVREANGQGERERGDREKEGNGEGERASKQEEKRREGER